MTPPKPRSTNRTSRNPASPSIQPTASRHAKAAQEVRILGGTWKRTPLPVPDAPGLRPTPSRVRETLFNWLGQDLSGWRCVDAFAGTGALGLEAASRGATEVLLLEHSAALAAHLRRTVARLQAQQVRVECGDALVALRRMAGQGWDVVFLDPPFAQGDNDGVIQLALQASAQAVAVGGFAYLESPRVWADAELAALGWAAVRRGRAGAVHHSLLRRAEADVPGTAPAEVAVAVAVA